MNSLKIGKPLVSFLFVLLSATSPRLGLCTEQGSHVEKYKKGVEHFRNSRFLEASRAFREAYDLKPSWKLWFNIAQSEASAKRYGRAATAFERYLVGGGDEVPEGRREVVLQELQRLRPIVGIVEVDPQIPSGAEVFVDGELWGTVPLEDPIRVAAQKHTVTVEMNGEVLVERRLAVPGQGTVTIVLKKVPADSGAQEATEVSQDATDHTEWELEDSVSSGEESSKSKILLWSGVGSGAVGLGLVGMGIGFNAKYSSDYDTYKNADPGTRREYKNDILPKDRGLSIGGYVAGGVFVAAGAALIVTSILIEDDASGESRLAAAPGGLRIAF